MKQMERAQAMEMWGQSPAAYTYLPKRHTQSVLQSFPKSERSVLGFLAHRLHKVPLYCALDGQ
jgi:hypothetical protein